MSQIGITNMSHQRKAVPSKLKEFFFELQKQDRESFATKCGTTAGQMRQIAYGNRPCNPALAINIDRESRGRVQCDDLCPDADWNYVRQQMSRKTA
jgi:DNA-binding transcriptional regulator YdaS (Cro superfamily)